MGIKKGVGLSAGPTLLADERPRLAALLGEVSNSWASVEDFLAFYLEYLISGPFKDDLLPVNPISNEIFSAVSMINQRVSIFRAVFSVRVADQALRTEHEKVLQKLLQAHARRNFFVHTMWSISPDYPEQIIALRPNRMDHKTAQPFGEQQLLEAVAVMQDALKLLHAFYVKVLGVLEPGLPLNVILTREPI